MRSLETAAEPFDLILYDAMNCLSIAFFSKPLSYEGIPTGMQFGVLRQIASLKKKYPKAKQVFLWEGFNSLRKAKYPTYKSNRRDKNDDFSASIADIKVALPLFGITQVSHIGVEADDLAAYYCLKHAAKKRILLVSNDRDWFSCVSNNNVKMLIKNEEYERDQLEFQCGFPPDRMSLYKVLRGDASDKIAPISHFPESLAIQMARHCKCLAEFKTYPFEEKDSKWKELMLSLWDTQVKENADLVMFHPDWIEDCKITILPPQPNDERAVEYLNNRGMFSLLHLFGLDCICKDEGEVVF